MTDGILVIGAGGLGGLQSVGRSTIFGDAVTRKIPGRWGRAAADL